MPANLVQGSFFIMAKAYNINCFNQHTIFRFSPSTFSLLLVLLYKIKITIIII